MSASPPTLSRDAGPSWQAIVDAMSVAMVVVGRDGHVLGINHAARIFVGLPGATPCPPLARLPFFASLKEPGASLLRLVADAFGGTDLVERRLPLDDDARAWAPQPMQMCVSVSPLGAPDAPPQAVLLHWRLERQGRGDSALRHRLAQLEDVVDKSAAVIFIKDLNSRYILANQAFLDLFHLRSAVGLLDTHLFDPEVAKVLRDNDRAVIRRRRPLRIEERVPCEGVERIFLALKFPLFDAQGRLNALCGIATDITDVKRTEQENKRLTIDAQAAKEASKLKSRFLATMSHEIRTPLAGIIGLAGMLGHSGLSAQQQDLADRIDRAAKDLLTILNDILDISKLEAGKVAFARQPVAIADLLASVVDTFGPLASDKRLALEVAAAPGAPAWVESDATRLRQVVFNLVSNAIKFSGEGRIQVVVDFTADPEISRLAVVVQDEGIGIAAEDMDKVFGLFHQADASISRRFGGTGLGLSICRSIIEAQGGQIGVDSVVGRGSRFWFRLPTRAVDAPPVARKPATKKGVRLSGRVLVAEDNAVNQLVVLALLKRLGLSCQLAVDGEEAVRRATAEPFDVILMDCHMPQVDGLEATRRIRRLTQHRLTPIVALTANAMRGEKERCLEAGMNAHLVKPVDEAALREVLALWLAADARRPRQGLPQAGDA